MGEYDKYICTTLQKRDMLPGPTPEERDKLAAEGKRISMEHVLWMDDEVMPGAYYSESTWIWPTSYAGQIGWEEQMKRTPNPRPMFPHGHEMPELLSWWGTDPDHPEDTGSMGMIMGDEEVPLENSWVAYIPAGLIHMPTRGGSGKTTNIPVCHWTFGPGVYTREEDDTSEEKDPDLVRRIIENTKPGELKYAKYMVYGYPENLKKPDYMPELDPKYWRPMAYIDESVIPDAELGCDTMWLLPGEKSAAGQTLMDTHTLPYGTTIVLNAMNYDDITDLRAEAELWIGGEKHIINKSFGAYIPPNIECGPLVIRNIEKQLFFMIANPMGAGIKKYPGGS